MINQINFDNIFEMIDSYGNSDYKKMIDEIVEHYNNHLHFEKEGAYNNQDDQSLQMKIGLYYTTFDYFKDYLDSYKLLDQSGNVDINRINNDIASYIFNSIRSCLVASATANHPLLLRQIRELYDVIVIGIAINQINEKGQYILLPNYKEKINSVSIKKFSSKSFLRDIKSNVKKTVNDRNYFSYNVKSFTDDLEWTYPIFKLIDPYHKKVKLEKSEENGSWNITVSHIAHLLDIDGCNIVEFETEAFKHLSIFEHFSNSINPTIRRMEFGDNVEDLYKANIHKVRTSCKSASLFITHVIDSFFYAIAIPQRLSFVLSNIVRVIAYAIPNSVDNGFNMVLDELSGITYNDSKFMEIFKKKINLQKDKQKELVNKYFSCYKDKFLVTNDVFSIENSIKGDEYSLNNISIKYLNIFRSLLYGLRYYHDNEIPSMLTAKQTYMGYPKSVANLKTFISDDIENYREDDFDILTISVIQGISNIFNSILLGSNISILNESRILYESIIMKTYINIKFKDDESLKDDLISEYFDESSKVIMPQQKILVLRDEMIQNDLNNEQSQIRIKKQFSVNSERYLSMLDDDLLFSICKRDGLCSYDDILEYLGKRNINLHLSMFDKFYNQKAFETLPYLKNSKLSDDEMKLIIMDLSLLVFKTLKYDFIADKISDDTISEVIDLGIYMVTYDLNHIII